MATVHFSGSLAQYTGGVETLTVDVSRVRELVLAVTRRFPELTEPLEIMAIAVNGEVYAEADYLKLSAESEVHFVPQIAGG
jgi:molybdopterin converting factor small subunit